MDNFGLFIDMTLSVATSEQSLLDRINNIVHGDLSLMDQSKLTAQSKQDVSDLLTLINQPNFGGQSPAAVINQAMAAAITFFQFSLQPHHAAGLAAEVRRRAAELRE